MLKSVEYSIHYKSLLIGSKCFSKMILFLKWKLFSAFRYIQHAAQNCRKPFSWALSTIPWMTDLLNSVMARVCGMCVQIELKWLSTTLCVVPSSLIQVGNHTLYLCINKKQIDLSCIKMSMYLAFYDLSIVNFTYINFRWTHYSNPFLAKMGNYLLIWYNRI